MTAYTAVAPKATWRPRAIDILCIGALLLMLLLLPFMLMSGGLSFDGLARTDPCSDRCANMLTATMVNNKGFCGWPKLIESGS